MTRADHIHDWWCREQSPSGLVFACRVPKCRARRKAANEAELYRKHIADLEAQLRELRSTAGDAYPTRRGGTA